jgi:hypothetical protein
MREDTADRMNVKKTTSAIPTRLKRNAVSIID